MCIRDSQKTVVMDEGLRAYMLKVYNYMATGVLLTGVIALISFKMSVVTDSTGAISEFTSIGNALFLWAQFSRTGAHFSGTELYVLNYILF